MPLVELRLYPGLTLWHCSWDQVWCHDADELTRRDHLGFLPEFRKVTLVACHQVVGARGIGTFQELVIVRVRCHLQRARGFEGVGMATDELQHLLLKALAYIDSRAREHFPVFSHNRVGDIEP